jgi:pimeloyl-ACP methyl ester carboxylesterase
MLGLSMGVGGCAIRTPMAPQRSGLAGLTGPASGEIRWPERPEDPIRLLVREGGEFLELIDHGRRGKGRLHEMRWRPDALPPDQGRLDYEIVIGSERSDWIRLSGDMRRSDRSAAERASQMRMLLFTSERRVAMENADGSRLELDPWNPDLTLVWLNVPGDRELRGTVLFLSSLGGMTSGETALIRELIDRDWGVVWTSPPLSRLRDEIPSIGGPDELEWLSSVIAVRINENLAQRAYAMEAALELLHEDRPDLTAEPSVLVGCSAGAINLPAMAARMPERADAAVLVAGGADVLDIVTSTSLAQERIRLRVGDRAPRWDELERLKDLVREQATLDPYHASAFLSDTPVLLLHAMLDTIVPARNGDLLYERLGRPERWSYPMGHLLLFAWLPTQAAAIADWIDDALEPVQPDQR